LTTLCDSSEAEKRHTGILNSAGAAAGNHNLRKKEAPLLSDLS